MVDTDHDETSAEVLKAAADQLRGRLYATEVLAAGATEVHQCAVDFDDNRCWVEVVPA